LINFSNNIAVRKDSVYAIQSTGGKRLELEGKIATGAHKDAWGNWNKFKFVN
jgi:hypothetical protein